MWPILLSLALAAGPAPATPSPAAPDSDAYPSEQALRHYLQGRWLELQGQGAEARAEFSRALSLDPDAVDLMLHLAEAAGDGGEPGRALELADRVLAKEPGNVHARWLRGVALVNLGRPVEAIDPLADAVHADSTNSEYVLTYGRVADMLGRVREAASAWRRAVELDPEDAESWFQLASTSARLGEYGLADSALDRSVELNPVRPGTLFLRGWIRESSGRLDEAIALYRHHLEVHPNDQATRRRLVVLLGRAGRDRDAYREARKLAADEPGDPTALQAEAETAFASGDAAAGERALERMRALAPGDLDLVLRSVAVLARHDRKRQALALADAWAHARPGDERSLALQARAHALTGGLDSAAAYAARAVAAAPESLDARRLLARIYQDAKRWPEAVAAYREALARVPDDPLLLLDFGFCLEQSGDVPGAIEMGRKALARAPDLPGALNFLGYLLADHERDLDEALSLIRRALDQDPENGAYVDSYGWVLYRLGRFEESRVQLENALRLSGGDPVIHEHLGDVYRALRMPDRAREQYRASLEADSRNARVRNKLEQLH